MVLFPAQKLAVDDLVPLVAKEAVERLDDAAEVEALGHRLDAVLALGRAVVVVGALKNEAEALGDEADLCGLTPTKEVERDLAQAVVLRHVVHGGAPAADGAVERLFRRRERLALLACDRLDAREARVLRGPDRVVEVELGRKIPLAVVGVLAADIVGVQGQEGLVGGHARGARVELDHEKVEDVARGVCDQGGQRGEGEGAATSAHPSESQTCWPSRSGRPRSPPWRGGCWLPGSRRAAKEGQQGEGVRARPMGPTYGSRPRWPPALPSVNVGVDDRDGYPCGGPCWLPLPPASRGRAEINYAPRLRRADLPRTIVVPPGPRLTRPRLPAHPAPFIPLVHLAVLAAPSARTATYAGALRRVIVLAGTLHALARRTLLVRGLVEGILRVRLLVGHDGGCAPIHVLVVGDRVARDGGCPAEGWRGVPGGVAVSPTRFRLRFACTSSVYSTRYVVESVSSPSTRS